MANPLITQRAADQARARGFLEGSVSLFVTSKPPPAIADVVMTGRLSLPGRSDQAWQFYRDGIDLVAFEIPLSEFGKP